MTELSGESYKDEQDQKEGGTRPGEGRNDAPATTGTHRGWGDPQAGEDLRDDEPESED